MVEFAANSRNALPQIMPFNVLGEQREREGKEDMETGELSCTRMLVSVAGGSRVSNNTNRRRKELAPIWPLALWQNAAQRHFHVHSDLSALARGPISVTSGLSQSGKGHKPEETVGPDCSLSALHLFPQQGEMKACNYV